MRHILAVVILGVSLACTASAALAYSDHNTSGIPQRSWDGVQAQPAQVQLFSSDALSGGPLSVMAGPGTDDGYKPYRSTPSGNGGINANK